MKDSIKNTTLIMVNFFSDRMLNACISKIPEKYKIIIINNSVKQNITKLIKRKKNLKIINSKKNLGNGAGINLGLKNVKTKYALYLDIDTVLKKFTIHNLYLLAEKYSGWAILSPRIKKKLKQSDIIKKINNEIYEVKFVEGCALFFNMRELNRFGYFDENFFLYYEENDIFFKYLKNKKKILLANKIYIKHIGTSSHNKKYDEEIKLNRDWHLMWSKFYYYKKNFSYFVAVKHTLRSLVSSFIKSHVYKYFNKKRANIYKSRFSGLINSYIGRPSSRRPKIYEDI